MAKPFNHCGKCKHLRRAKKPKKIVLKDGGVVEGGTFLEHLQAYYCPYRWWSDRPTYDTCEHFEHKRKEE